MIDYPFKLGKVTMNGRRDNLKLKRIDKDLPLPKYATPGSVGLDLYARETRAIGSHDYCLIPLNIIGQAQKDYFIAVLPRSSTFKKKGLIMANSIGIIDHDYCGPEDEIQAIVYNTNDHEVTVEKGERLFQMVMLKIAKPDIEEVEHISDVSRGGIGSTG